MTRPILVFGASGRVGGVLRDLVHTSSQRWVAAHDAYDIRNRAMIVEAIEKIAPVAIVNLAACTLPYAEKPEALDEAMDVNCVAVANMAELCAERGIPIVHLTTDCIWDGTKEGPYAEVWPNSPANWYGETKFRGEEAIRNMRAIYGQSAPHIILRTTGVYLAGKPNFLKLVLDKARAGESMDVIADTLYSPTDARELARAILTATERVIEDPSVSGTYHFAGPDVMSYMDFADLVLEEAGLSMPIHATTMAEREAIEGFKRPKNAALNSDKFAEVFGLRHRPTRDCVKELVKPR